MIKTMLFGIFLMFFIGIQTSAQSPWVNKKGSSYSQLSFTYLSYENYTTDVINMIVPAEQGTLDLTTSFYSEYSFSDQLAILINLPYKSVTFDEQNLSSFGDATVKVKYQFSKAIPVSAYVGYTAPLSKREGILRTGYMEHATELGLSAGMGQAKYFLYGGMGYRYRPNIPAQLFIELEFGYELFIAKKSLYVIAHIDGLMNTTAIKDLEAGEAVLYHYNGEFLSPALKASYNVYDQFWINGAVHFAFLVRNFGATPTFNFGIAYKLTK